MATSPYPENPKNQTVSNLDAWKKAGASVDGASNGPILSPVKTIRESELPSKVGSISFSAKESFKSSLAVNEEYSAEELNTVVDSIILHIKDMAEQGDMKTGINISKFNDGLSRQIIKELRSRGFIVSRGSDHESVLGLNVSWERRVDWKIICACVLIAIILLGVPIGFYLTAKANKPVTVTLEQIIEK